jgi:hypothetical protein
MLSSPSLALPQCFHVGKAYHAPTGNRHAPTANFKLAADFEHRHRIKKPPTGVRIIPSSSVYADKIIRIEMNADTGEASEHAIPFIKGYTVFNVEQIDGLPDRFYAKAEPRGDPTSRAPPAGKPKSRVSLPLRCPCGADLTGTIEKHSGISSLASVFSGLLGRCAEGKEKAGLTTGAGGAVTVLAHVRRRESLRYRGLMKARKIRAVARSFSQPDLAIPVTSRLGSARPSRTGVNQTAS